MHGEEKVVMRMNGNAEGCQAREGDVKVQNRRPGEEACSCRKEMGESVDKACGNMG
jgi:hypothetical protein